MKNNVTFLDLAQSFSINIPRIQRDYAQGRLNEETTAIRKNFVDTLTSALSNDSAGKDLNFIYGSTGDEDFIPLDGQQRLTTLFILHVYLEGIFQNLKKENPVYTDFNFTYATRSTSTDFCTEFVKNRQELFREIFRQYEIFKEWKNSKKKDVVKPELPSVIIKNEPWFVAKWVYDPTVAGMLVMLDEIHSRYVGKEAKVEKAYKRLFKERALYFQFQPLHKFKRTDDLFIKMNSRGLGLTDFEIFKSKIVEDFENNLENNSAEEFKNKIDKEWNDFLWKKRSDVKPEGVAKRSVDIIFTRLLKFIIPAEAAALGQPVSKEAEVLFERNNETMRFTHIEYLKHNVAFSPDLLETLLWDMDYLCTEASSALGKNLKCNFGNDKYGFDISGSLSRVALEGLQLDYDDTIMLYAWLRFSKLFANAFPFPSTSSQMKNWLKTIFNIVKASGIDSASGLVNALKGINYLAYSYSTSNQGDIYKWLANAVIAPPSGLSRYQIQEEVAKAKLRQLPSATWSVALDRAESDDFTKGQIGFILECAGIIEMKDKELQMNIGGILNNENKYLSEFKKYSDLLIPLFDSLRNDNDVIKKHILVRAMLVKGDYLLRASDNCLRWSIGNHRDDRDYSWYALLNPGNDREGRKVLKSLIEDPRYDASKIIDSLEEIASTVIPDAPAWRRILTGINGHQLLSRAKKGFLYFTEEDENVRMLGSKNLRGYHDELHTYNLYLSLPTKPDNVDYERVKGDKEKPGIVVRRNINDKTETAKLTHWNGKWKFKFSEGWPKDSLFTNIDGYSYKTLRQLLTLLSLKEY